jgi:hypothetical protein
MRIIFLAGVVALAGCSKSRCEKYADMEIKCGGYPKSEEDFTRAMAEGACESMDKNDKVIGAHIQHEADCAAKHMNDCAAYKACTEAEPK